MEATLGSRLQRLDRERFVGRRAELEAIAELFVDEPPASVVLVHGPGGIGKSTLLRQVARVGAVRGWTPHRIEGRDLPPVPDALEDALAGVFGDSRPLLLIDTYERIAGLNGYLRRAILPTLPARTIAVIAGRHPPDPGWRQDGWEHLARIVELGGLSDAEGVELLRAHGWDAAEDARPVLLRAAGSPLALSLAAQAGTGQARSSGTGQARSGGASAPPRGGFEDLFARLVEAEDDPLHHGALAVAAVARVTTVDLLRDTLTATNAEAAYAWLASRSFTEPLGEGVALHDLVRQGAHARLRGREPERERDLRRRIADHLHARAVAGRPLLSIDLAHLVEDPVLRWGYSWEGAARYRIDEVRPGDVEAIGERLAAGDRAAVWAAARPFFAEAPSTVAVARDVDDRVAGYTIAVTPATAPAVAERDPRFAAWLQEARRLSPDGNAVVWHDSVDLTGDPLPWVQAMLGLAGILRSGLANPRIAFLPVNRSVAGAAAFSAALGARHVRGLDVRYGRQLVECHVVDYGPGGLLGMQRDVVHREAGFQAPAVATADPVVAEQVRAALRHFGVPHELARSELAVGRTAAARAESVRALLRDAAEQAFGDGADEQLLRRVLVRGYLDPAPTHEAAAQELHVSRATYFRRLRVASERVADHIASSRR